MRGLSSFMLTFLITTVHSCTVDIIIKLSSSSCTVGKSFGCYDNNTMWTNSGCRGIFKCNNASVVDCESQEQSFTECQCISNPLNFTTYLLLDDRNVIENTGAQIVLGPVTKSAANPLVREERSWEMRFDNMQPNTWWDPEHSIWKLWYNSFSSCGQPIEKQPDCQAHASPCPGNSRDVETLEIPKVRASRGGVICYAESKDGITWTKPDLGLVSWNGSKHNNILFNMGTDSAGGGLGAGITLDPTAPASSRWKLAGEKDGKMWIATSEEGKIWQSQLISNTDGRFDTHKNTVFDTKSQRWINYLRCTPTTSGLRIQCYIESEGANYSNTKWGVATPTGLNTTDTYQPDALVVFPYAGIWIGFANVFNPTTKPGPTAPNTVNTVLAWSTDARRWKYIQPDKSFVPRDSSSGDWDCCGIFAAKQSPELTPAFIQGKTKLPFYYTGCNGLFFGARACSLGMVEMGRHAFAGYAGPGTITTAPVKVLDVVLRVTAFGGVKVGVVDDKSLLVSTCSPINGTEIPVQWKGQSLSSLTRYYHGAVTLTFEIPAGAILYAYHL